jgi:hypothetical protein
MKIEVPDLTGAECGDIAITAAEGGTGYWAQIESYDWKRWSHEDSSMGNIEVADDFVFYRIAPLYPDESGFDWSQAQDVTPAWIRAGFERGLVAARDRGGWAIQDLMSVAREDWTGEIDSNCADLIFQFAFYGEIVWG